MEAGRTRGAGASEGRAKSRGGGRMEGGGEPTEECNAQGRAVIRNKCVLALPDAKLELSEVKVGLYFFYFVFITNKFLL